MDNLEKSINEVSINDKNLEGTELVVMNEDPVITTHPLKKTKLTKRDRNNNRNKEALKDGPPCYITRIADEDGKRVVTIAYRIHTDRKTRNVEYGASIFFQCNPKEIYVKRKHNETARGRLVTRPVYVSVPLSGTLEAYFSHREQVHREHNKRGSGRVVDVASVKPKAIEDFPDWKTGWDAAGDKDKELFANDNTTFGFFDLHEAQERNETRLAALYKERKEFDEVLSQFLRRQVHKRGVRAPVRNKRAVLA